MKASARENYLKYLFELQQEQREAYISVGELAKSVGVTASTCTSMVKKLHEAGLVDHQPYSGVKLTKMGIGQAVDILRRHRIMELFLVEVVGIDWADVHDEAERLEHAVSALVLERIDEMLGFPSADPHGDPIPSAAGDVRRPEMTRLIDCEPGKLYRIARVLDEAADFLRYLGSKGLKPGTQVKLETISQPGDSVALSPEGGESITIGLTAAQKLMVEM
jgi:DtxR family Mn-dependent transcriptional regulator